MIGNKCLWGILCQLSTPLHSWCDIHILCCWLYLLTWLLPVDNSKQYKHHPPADVPPGFGPLCHYLFTPSLLICSREVLWATIAAPQPASAEQIWQQRGTAQPQASLEPASAEQICPNAGYSPGHCGCQSGPPQALLVTKPTSSNSERRPCRVCQYALALGISICQQVAAPVQPLEIRGVGSLPVTRCRPRSAKE